MFEVYSEVTAAARELARKNLAGEVGDPLPNLMSAASCAWINEHLGEFKGLVAEALAGEGAL